MAAKDYALARRICEAVREVDDSLIVLGLSGSEMVRAAKDLGLRVALEVFADRAYEEDGSLVNRRKEGAMILDEKEAPTDNPEKFKALIENCVRRIK